MHRRRDFLGGLATVLATSTGSRLRRSDAGRAGAPRLASVDRDPPPDLPVEPSVSIADGTATREHPPRITVAWTNEADASIRLGEARSAFFALSVSDDGGAILLGDEWGSHDVATATGGCWHTTRPVNGDGAYRVVEVAPGERHETSSGLYGYRGSCLSAGTYAFRNTVGTWDPHEPEGHGPSASWGFALEVAADGGGSDG